MVDFNCCDHECVCQHNGHLEAAQQYSSILSKVMSKNADSEYVSKEDKDNWNNKADKDLVDLIKVMVEKHEERLDDLEDNLDKKIKVGQDININEFIETISKQYNAKFLCISL